MSDTARANVLEELVDDTFPRLHWVDNFAKYYASASMVINKVLMKECQWTAHASQLRVLWNGNDVAMIPSQRCPT